jgi:hypothetical protein
LRVGFDPYDESPIKRRGEDYLEHEFHEGQDIYDRGFSKDGASYDYEGYPSSHASNHSRSRPGTPVRSLSSPCSQSPTFNQGEQSRSSMELPERIRQPPGNVSSPSPLLRRATTQPSHFKSTRQPSFKGPLTAPRTSSSPRQDQSGAPVQSFRGSVAPDTPPSSVRK